MTMNQYRGGVCVVEIIDRRNVYHITVPSIARALRIVRHLSDNGNYRIIAGTIAGVANT